MRTGDILCLDYAPRFAHFGLIMILGGNFCRKSARRFERQAVILVIIFICVSRCLSVQSGSRRNGCTSPSLLPNKPFLVVWNHPSQVCEKHGINFDFAKWGIVVNNNDSFVGEKISLLYRPGQWPYYSQTVSHNGGIPQLGNEKLHIQKLKAAIDSKIHNHSFSGLGVIDFEQWRPLYSLNFDRLRIYQQKSLELAKQRHPSYNKSQILNEAVNEFEQAARPYIEDSLKTVTALRPSGQWGYYGYPRCWDTNCNSSTISINDRMGWVFAASSALYPSIYFQQSMPLAARAKMITGRLMETLRVQAKWTPTDTAIFPYSLNQNGPYSFFTPDDLNYSIKLPADLGSSGVSLWGSSASVMAKNECRLLQDYINTTLGPYSKQIVDFFSSCSAKLCSGHGRCVRKDYEAVYQSHLTLDGRKHCGVPPHRLQMSHKRLRQSRLNQKLRVHASSKGFLGVGDFDDYVCKCYVEWSGPHCDQK